MPVSTAAFPTETVPYIAPVAPEAFFRLWVVLCSVGMALMAYFFVYQMQKSRSGKKGGFFVELTIATTSSVFLGFGFLFLLLWAGVWV